MGEGLTLSTTERLKETTREVHFRFTHIMLDGRPLWQETRRRADQSRSNQIYRNCPFDIGFDISESTGKERLSLIDDESRFVALLVRKEDGRLAPVTDEELERLQKVAQDVSDFGMELLERADELMDDEEAANEVKRKLDQAVEEYNQGASDRPNVQSSQRTRSRNPSESMKPFTALTSRDVAASSMPAIGINLAHGELDIYV